MSQTLDWREYYIAKMVYECVGEFQPHRPLCENLTRIFSYLCESFRYLYNYRTALHLFLNVSQPALGELHCLKLVEQEMLEISDLAYERKTLSRAQFDQLRSLVCKEGNSLSQKPKDICLLSVEDTRNLLKLVDILDGSDVPGLLIPFDFDGLNLGAFILWGEPDNASEKISPDRENLRGCVYATYHHLQNFFKREFPIVSSATYLPSFYSVKWAKAAILFADIRNFSPMTEILRNIYTRPPEQKTEVLQAIMKEYTEAMACIIQENNRGRIDRFFGAGIMGIFGEYEDNPYKSACTAVYVATRMLDLFQELRKKFLSMAFGKEYLFEYNDWEDIDLAIGIDYGTVLFDYLGDERYKEYTVIGDHVNFAKMIEHDAGQFDDEKQRLRSQILISRTVKKSIEHWLNGEDALIPYRIHSLEKKFAYTAFGLDPLGFNERMFLNSEQTNDWLNVGNGSD